VQQNANIFAPLQARLLEGREPRAIGQTEDDYDMLADGAVVGRIMKVTAVPEDAPWV
jgi:hypothetical protein